jgi:hypothetical protein
VLARLESGDGHLVVQVKRHGNDARVDIRLLEHRPVVFEGLCLLARDVEALLQVWLEDVADGGEPEPRDFHGLAHQVAPLLSRPDDADFEQVFAG